MLSFDDFDHLSEYHHWADHQKVEEIKPSFQGLAATWYHQLGPIVNSSWPHLWLVLSRAFGNTNTVKNALTQFEELCQEKLIVS